MPPGDSCLWKLYGQAELALDAIAPLRVGGDAHAAAAEEGSENRPAPLRRGRELLLKLRRTLGQDGSERIAVGLRRLVLELCMEPPPLGVQLPVKLRGFVDTSCPRGKAPEVCELPLDFFKSSFDCARVESAPALPHDGDRAVDGIEEG